MQPTFPQAPSTELVPVELANSAARPPFIVVHLDERESMGLACGAIADNVDGGDRPSPFQEPFVSSQPRNHNA